jgi:hypothetical protein
MQKHVGHQEGAASRLDLNIVTMLPASKLSNFSVSAELVSTDGAISIPVSPFTLLLGGSTFQANGGRRALL